MAMTRELVAWSHQKKCEKAVESLGKNGFAAVYCLGREDAVAYIVREAEDAASIGFGNSLSLADLEVADRLRETGKESLIHIQPGLSPEERIAVMRRQLTCDLFLTGCKRAEGKTTYTRAA